MMSTPHASLCGIEAAGGCDKAGSLTLPIPLLLDHPALCHSWPPAQIQAGDQQELGAMEPVSACHVGQAGGWDCSLPATVDTCSTASVIAAA